MRVGILCVVLLELIASSSFGAQFNMSSWILIFEPQNKVLSQMVTYTYQGPNPNAKSDKQGPLPNNEENAPVPVEISISGREIGSDGSVLYPNSDGADNFVVYPSQFILYPGDTKKIQVQWVGSTAPPKEIAYGFISTQLPLEINNGKPKPKSAMGSVSVVSRFEGIIVVKLQGAKPEVVADTAYAGKDSTGTTLVFILNNKGKGLQTLKNMNLSVFPVDKAGKINFNQRVLVRDVKPTLATSQSLFPGYRRKVVVPWPADLPVGPVNVLPEFTDGKK